MGRSFEVVAPCVITQWPGEHVVYGPDETWDEWYFTYHGKAFPLLCERGLLDKNQPLWRIADPSSVHLLFREFQLLTESEDPPRVADLVDRVAERAIIATIHNIRESHVEDELIPKIAAAIRADLVRDWNFDRIAKENGLSESTFRRRWAVVVGRPPAVYLQELRMAEACRLLVESQDSIKEIAAKTGFADTFYFSRRFRIEIGISPSAYREAYLDQSRILR